MALPTFADLAAAVYVNGNAVDKADVRAWGLTVETALNALFSNGVLLNGELVATVASNALTVAVKTRAGADPSATDPVYFMSRDVSNGDGSVSVIAITAAASVVVSSGSTLGFVSGVSGRLWVVGFNDGGTFKLGVVNLFESGTGIQHQLDESARASSTAEGGSGGADSAGVIYTTAAATSKAFRIIGFLTWESPLATAGTWDAVPDVIAMLTPGMGRPGHLVQRQRNATGATASGTTTVPLDDTIPQNTEGDEYLTQAITPKSKANILRVRGQLLLSNTAAVHIILGLFQDTTANALMALAEITAANGVIAFYFEYSMIAGTVSATTFKTRAGGSGAGTTRLNGVSGARIFGGVAISFLEVEEVVG